ncbi:MAG TPA: transcriptional regulator, partial [Streptosporangiaceae bacterium]|nr:transcriptional regulator [Streptosporangiaceae bacterium]
TRLVRDGLLTRDDARPGQKAAYSLTEQAIQLVPVFAQLGAWGRRHRPATDTLLVRAELLEQGGPSLWTDYMDELRETHLGVPRPNTRTTSVTERLAQAYVKAATPERPDGRAG